MGKIRDLEGTMGFEGLAENEAQKQRGMLESETAIFVASDSICIRLKETEKFELGLELRRTERERERKNQKRESRDCKREEEQPTEITKIERRVQKTSRLRVGLGIW